jgi:hypothetical protein
MANANHLWSHVGFDESNHGRFPEIGVIVNASYPKDYQLLSYDLETRRGPRGLAQKLKRRDYRFVLFSETDKHNLQKNPHKKLGLMLASLLYNEQIGDSLDLYLDGTWNHNASSYAIELISHSTGLPARAIHIYQKARLDRRMRIVNLADQTAYWIFNTSIKDLTENKQRKRFRVELL